jgi:serine/threonine-protein kinase
MGCILYYALAGRPPFPDSSPVRTLLRHIGETPPPLRELNPDVPEELAQVVQRMMAKDPAQRYQTPAEAALALQTLALHAAGPAISGETPADASASPSASEAAMEQPAAQPEGLFSFPAQPESSSPWEVAVHGWPAEGEAVPFEVPPLIVPPAATLDGGQAPARASFWRRRDFLMLLLGAGGLLAAQALGWLLAHLSSRAAGGNAPPGRVEEEQR